MIKKAQKENTGDCVNVLIFKYSSSLEHWTDCVRLISFFDVILQKKGHGNLIFKYIVNQLT